MWIVIGTFVFGLIVIDVTFYSCGVKKTDTNDFIPSHSKAAGNTRFSSYLGKGKEDTNAHDKNLKNTLSKAILNHMGINIKNIMLLHQTQHQQLQLQQQVHHRHRKKSRSDGYRCSFKVNTKHHKDKEPAIETKRQEATLDTNRHDTKEVWWLASQKHQ